MILPDQPRKQHFTDHLLEETGSVRNVYSVCYETGKEKKYIHYKLNIKFREICFYNEEQNQTHLPSETPVVRTSHKIHKHLRKIS